MLSNRNLLAAALVVGLAVGGFFLFKSQTATDETGPAVLIEVIVPDLEEN
jgi:hypothetical protein